VTDTEIAGESAQRQGGVPVMCAQPTLLTLTPLWAEPRRPREDRRRLEGRHHRLRRRPVRQIGGTAYVAGVIAAGIDVSAKLASALPLFVTIIVVLLLMPAFRSVLVPLKARGAAQRPGRHLGGPHHGGRLRRVHLRRLQGPPPADPEPVRATNG
jgi:hypothetical protein